MSAKVQWYRGAWWVMTHANRRRWRKRVGPSKEAKREAEEIARKLNAALALGVFNPDAKPQKPLPLGQVLRDWHRRYSVTFKPRYQETSLALIEAHLLPAFGAVDLRELREDHLLDYIRAKVDEGYAPATILTGLSILRRVVNLAVKEGHVVRNPVLRVGELIARVARRTASEVPAVDAWSRGEVETLLALAESPPESPTASPLAADAQRRRNEAVRRFAPLLRFLLSTGCRRGEALGLRWEDVDFERRRVTIRRALTRGVTVTPKSGRARHVALAPTLAEALFDLLAQRRREAPARGWLDVPPWVFCSETGGPLDEGNVERSWYRLRRLAQKRGVRPLKLHAARHTFASLALAAGRSVRWVAEQLGHSNPELTLRVYAHALPVDEADLAFADFARAPGGASRLADGPRRPYAAPRSSDALGSGEAPRATSRGASRILEHETGLEPATSTLAKPRDGKK